ncbi:MAG: VTT domain-containing protein [Burkholderiaceae bacterium]|jgi:membrane-associated protein
MEFVQMVLHLDRYLGVAIGEYGFAVYLLLFLIVFCEIGIAPLFILPGDPLVFICGAFCATGALSALVLVPVLIAATILGSAVAYGVGIALGRKVFSHDYRWLHRKSLEKTARFYGNHGGLLLVFSPFLAVVRTFAPLLAGVFELNPLRFFQYVVLGAVFWVGLLVAGGFLFGNVPIIRDYLSLILVSGTALALLAILLSSGLRWYSKRQAR